MGRAPCCDKSKVKRGPWSPEEDTTLKNYIERYGTGGNWIALPHKAGLKRCGKSCRLRWLNYLRPDIKHGGFTEEEDNIILTLYSNIGSRWSVIATHLQGRTDNDVKNYWNTKLKKKLLGGKTNNLTSNNSMASSTPSSRAFGSKVDDMINSNSVLPYYPMNYDQHNPCQQLPLPHINGYTSVSSSISQQVSTSFSSENNINAPWSGNGDRDDGFLMDSGSGFQFPYHDDVLNSFYFQDN